MEEYSSLNLAIKYLHQKQYQKAETILHNLIKTIPFDEKIVLYYGYCLIEQGKYEDALVIYRQYLTINSDKYRLLRAYCYAKMGFLEKALTDWIKLSKEGNKIAISLLSDLKKAKDNKTFITFLKYNKACGSLSFSNNVTKEISKKSFFNKENAFSFLIKQKKLILTVSVVVILIFFSFFIFFNIKNLKQKSEIKPNSNTSISNSSLPITNIYLYNDKKQVEKDISLAKNYISQTDYNNARLLLNKIIFSNAEEKYKGKAKNLEHLLTEPLFNKLTFNPQYNEVVQNPLLYLKVYIQWKGLVYDLIDDYRFSVMIYSKNPIYIDGICLCILPKPYPLFVKQQVEIFGKILKIEDNKEPKIEIEIKNIRVIYE